jgi:hypothetical protein
MTMMSSVMCNVIFYVVWCDAEIYMKAAKIIRTYFESEEDVEEGGLAPQHAADGQQFAFGAQPQGGQQGQGQQGGFQF